MKAKDFMRAANDTYEDYEVGKKQKTRVKKSFYNAHDSNVNLDVALSELFDYIEENGFTSEDGDNFYYPSWTDGDDDTYFKGVYDAMCYVVSRVHNKNPENDVDDTEMIHTLRHVRNQGRSQDAKKDFIALAKEFKKKNK